MNPLLETILAKNLILDIAGLAGLGLITAAALSMTFKWRSWGGYMMAAGAISLFLARLWLVIAPHLLTVDAICAIGPLGNSLAIGLPPLFLTFGLAGIVWGLWSHERWLKEDLRP